MEKQYLVAERLYSNTLQKYMAESDSVIGAMQCWVLEDLKVLLHMRDRTYNPYQVEAVVDFFKSTGLNCEDVYFLGRNDDGIETCFTMGHMNSDEQFQIFVQRINDKTSVGIIQNY